jgi:hypothetical protein
MNQQFYIKRVVYVKHDKILRFSTGNLNTLTITLLRTLGLNQQTYIISVVLLHKKHRTTAHHTTTIF